MKRLYETAQFVHDVNLSVPNIQPPNGEGFKSIVRVRLLHATVRRRILKLAAKHSEYYDVKTMSTPLNDLHLAYTIAVFSSLLYFVSFPRQGIFLREQKIVDATALWRYIAYVIGAPEGLLKDVKKSKAIMETMFINDLQPGTAAGAVGRTFIKAITGQPLLYPSEETCIAAGQWLLGRDLMKALGIPQARLFNSFTIALKMFPGLLWAYVARSVPFLDRKNIEILRKSTSLLIMSNRFGLKQKRSKFDFQYVPQLDTLEKSISGSSLRGTSRTYTSARVLIRLSLFITVVAWVLYHILGADQGKNASTSG